MLHIFDPATLRNTVSRKADTLMEICGFLERAKVSTDKVDQALRDLGQRLSEVIGGKPPRQLPTGTAQALYVACRQRSIWTEGESMGVFLMTIMEVLRRRGAEVCEWDE